MCSKMHFISIEQTNFAVVSVCICTVLNEADLSRRSALTTHLGQCLLWWCQHQRGWAPPPSPLSPRYQPAGCKESALRDNLRPCNCPLRRTILFRRGPIAYHNHNIAIESTESVAAVTLLPWWCVWGTFLWLSWQTPQSTQSSHWPHPDRCTWGWGRLPRWRTASPDLHCRSLNWQLHAAENSHKNVCDPDSCATILFFHQPANFRKTSGCYLQAIWMISSKFFPVFHRVVFMDGCEESVLREREREK